MGGVCSMHGEVKNAYEVLYRNYQRKRQLEKLRRRWQDNMKREWDMRA
jgi:hypothetical protein